MKAAKILWVDDEIDLLKPHILFLEEKGYQLMTTTNADDAFDLLANESFDLILLDEHMPGLSGLEALSKIKDLNPSAPVVMITKSEEENIMEEAIGSQIDDYLIKPVNPNQILLSIKKQLENKKLITEKTISNYQTQFQEISQQIQNAKNYDDWCDVYRKLVYWELNLEDKGESNMKEVLAMQKSDANTEFAKYIQKNYRSWFEYNNKNKPLLSPNVFQQRVVPLLKNDENIVLILIDNLRFDHWKFIAPMINEHFNIEYEEIYYSILPTATQYSRNSFFAGLMPYEISKIYPDIWLDDEDEGGKNLKEEELLNSQIERLGLDLRFNYQKVNQPKTGKKVIQSLHNMLSSQLNVFIYNYIDMLSHARTEFDVLKELANNESAYRSLTYSWFKHSPLNQLLKELSEKKAKVIITTDHGSILVQNPKKVVGDKKTSVNLRYKHGKNLSYKKSEVFAVTDPNKIHLPKPHVNSKYIFATNQDYLVYPNNYNYYANYYKSTFQHGGISMEEMLIPFIVLNPKE